MVGWCDGDCLEFCSIPFCDDKSPLLVECECSSCSNDELIVCPLTNKL